MPYVFGKQYSATEEISTFGSSPVESEIFVDDGKIRMEIPSHGSKVIAIVRPDLQTVYWIIMVRKQLLALPFDSERIKKLVPPEVAIPGHSQSLGLETVLGIACRKCRLTNESGKPFLLWTDVARNTPVKISAEDGTCMLVWKNYRAGPQNAALFVPPDDCQEVEMPLPPRLPDPLNIPPKGLGK
jgi:hypothetical protein